MMAISIASSADPRRFRPTPQETSADRTPRMPAEVMTGSRSTYDPGASARYVLGAADLTFLPGGGLVPCCPCDPPSGGSTNLKSGAVLPAIVQLLCGDGSGCRWLC